MKKIITLLFVIMLFMLLGLNLKAQWTNIPFTGFNADVVANGSNSSTSSTTNSVDGTNVFIDGTYSPGFTVCETSNVWPANLSVSSLITPGLTYILQAPNVSNSFRLYAGSSGTITLTTPTACTDLKFLSLGGGDSVNFSATVTFSDATTQTFPSLTVPNWTSGTNPATGQFYQTVRGTSLSCSCSLGQYMYEVDLPIDSANQSKTISSISVTNPTGSVANLRLHFFALGGYIVPVPCSTPANQPTNLTLTPGTTSTATGSFTASAGSPSPNHYLIVRSTSDTLTQVPVNGHIYTAGSSFGGGTVVAYQSGTTFSDAGLTAGTMYYYFVFAANSNCIDTSRYVTANPLIDSTSIWNGILTSSNLPIIVVNTNNVPIYNNDSNASYTPGHMGIIYNGPGVRNYITDPFNNYNDSLGIRVRGSSTRMFPQLSYTVETWDENGNQMNVEVLGMPSENDWALYAPYDDKSCMRNALTYALANETGHWAARTQFAELVLNGQYWGIYMWEERIKRNANRVNIVKLEPTDTVGDAVTGGYILKIDKTTGTTCTNDGWNSPYTTAAGSTIRFLYDDPECDDIVQPQMNYIAAYVDSFETALKASNFADPVNGYRKYIDVNSFIDYFIINEITNNVDGLRLSTFFFKNRNSLGGKLIMGPVWDYNEGYGNANYDDGNLYTGWAYQMTESYTGAVPFWWARFMQDTLFENSLRCRWFDLRKTVLSIPAINNYIDSMANYLNEALARHFTKWPILGVYEWPEPTPIPTTYAGEISNLKSWIQNRFAWLDANMVGTNSYPTVNLGSDTAICPGQPFILNAGNTGCAFQWNTGDTSQAIAVNSAGTYSVTVSRDYGCKSSDTISITLNSVITISAGNDTSICKGSSVVLTVTGNGSFAYTWNNGVVQGVPFVPNATQYYTVTATGSNGCSTQDSVLVSVVPLPPQPVITVIWGATDTLISSSPTGNQWYKDGNILLGENGQKLLISSLVAGNYTVVVNDSNGCVSSPSEVFTITTGIKEYSGNFGFVVYPNPFKDKTTITYTLKVSENIRIALYDVTGREVEVLTNSTQNKGQHTINVDATILRSGVYYFSIKAGEDTYTGKIIKIN